ncbi:MAG: YraN family protein, partial [Planctomycetes bacterium]|nr:YraN family protein [Planctomycetota bacterium]
MMPPRHPRDEPGPVRQRGRRGEDLAAAALAHAGFRIVGRNLRTRHGEIDLLVRRGPHYRAVEVKARADHPAPERCLDPDQLDRLERSLQSLAATLRPRPRSLAVDVVAVRWSDQGPELLHFPTFRTVPWPTDAIGPTRRAHAWVTRRPTSPCTSHPPLPLPLPPMPTLADQIIPRRKLLLMLCETILFMGVLLVGTSAPPLSTRSFHLLEFSPELLRGLLTCFTIAVICQASLSYNDLYDWKTAQNRAELANRLVHAAGYALVMLGFLALVGGSMFVLPGIQNINQETWKLIVLVGIAFGFVWAFRVAFHWFFYKWRFGERIVVVGSSEEAQKLARMVMESPMSGYEVLGIVEEPGQPPLPVGPGLPPLLGSLEGLRTLCREEGIARVVVALRERRGK